MNVCPDCHADIELWADVDGVMHLTVRHDRTCPWLASREQRAHTTRPTPRKETP